MARRDKDADDLEALAAEIETVRPYLDLAQEIRHAVELFATDDAAEVESLVAALDSIPARERGDVARSIFDRLSPDRQWAVIERAFGDDEIRDYLERDRSARLAELRSTARQQAIARQARVERRLDTGALPDAQEVTLGLFLPADVRAALDRGVASQVCARQIVLRATAVQGELQVIGDTFNPRRGLFVTAAYDQRVFATEQLMSHAVVRIGSLTETETETETATGSGPALEPVLYPGARVDVEVDGVPAEGRLHLGFVLIGDEDVYAVRN